MVWASCALESACVVKARGQMMQPRWFDVSLTCIVCIVVKSSLLLDIKMLMQEHEMIRTCGHFRTPIEVSLLSATSAEEI